VGIGDVCPIRFPHPWIRNKRLAVVPIHLQLVWSRANEGTFPHQPNRSTEFPPATSYRLKSDMSIAIDYRSTAPASTTTHDVTPGRWSLPSLCDWFPCRSDCESARAWLVLRNLMTTFVRPSQRKAALMFAASFESNSPRCLLPSVGLDRTPNAGNCFFRTREIPPSSSQAEFCVHNQKKETRQVAFEKRKLFPPFALRGERT